MSDNQLENKLKERIKGLENLVELQKGEKKEKTLEIHFLNLENDRLENELKSDKKGVLDNILNLECERDELQEKVDEMEKFVEDYNLDK